MRLGSEPSIQVDEYPAARQSLRVAVVTETYPPEVNGVAATIASFVHGLRSRNHVVQVVRPRQSTEADAADSDHQVLTTGVPIPRYPHLKMGLPSKRALVNLWKLRRPDVVHVVTEGPLGWSAVQAAATLRLPVCSDFRTNFHSYSRHYGIGWLQRPILAYLRKFHNRTQVTMVPTESLQRQLRTAGFRNVQVVARGVDTTLFTPARRSELLRGEWGAAPDSRVAMHVGRLASEKNVGVLVAAYDALRALDPKLVFVFVGDGPARGELRARCPGAVFAGMRKGVDLAAHYASGDIFVFPSTTETFGNVTAEAMASGLAVVAYDYAAANALIDHGTSGMLAPLDDERTFLRLASELVRDPLEVGRIGAAARRVAESHSWDRVVTQLEAVFLQVIREAILRREAIPAAPEPVIPMPFDY
ncbi:MAG: glycosyltransferase family 4 protein [Burkholderiaceae bacterium]